MAGTASPIPLSWMDHGYAPRDLSQSLHLSPMPQGVELALTRSHVYTGIFSLACSVPCFALWAIYTWGSDRYDTEMKWIAVVAGIIFVLLFVLALTLPWRYRRYGQHLLVDQDLGRVRVNTRTGSQDFPLNAVAGLQTLSRNNESQCNLVLNMDGITSRVWIHTDLLANIAKLVSDFEAKLGWQVVSDIRCVGKRG